MNADELADYSSIGVNLNEPTDSVDNDIVTVHVPKKLAMIPQTSTLLCISESVDNFLLLEVFRFLSSEELCRICSTCYLFNKLGGSPSLWKDLNARSFHFIPEEIASIPKQSAVVAKQIAIIIDPTQSLQTAISMVAPPANLSYKEIYHRSYEQMKRACVRDARAANEFYEVRAQDEQLFRAGHVMDLLEIYIYIPLVLVTLLLFVVLVALKIDNTVPLSYWVVFSPLILLFAYSLGCMLLSGFVYSNQYNAASVFRGLSEHFSSPIHLLIAGVSAKGKIFVVGGVSVCLIGCVTLCLKLTAVVSPFGWAYVFVPAWVLLFMFCAAPCAGVVEDMGMFVLMGLLGWVPAFTVFLCLTLRLDAAEQRAGEPATNPGQGKLHYENLRLAAMFTPFWIIEGGAMLVALVFFCLACYRHYLGYEESYAAEVGGAFGLSWCVLGLILAFQIMLCFRVDGDGVNGNYDSADYSYLSAMDVVAPLCVLLGWLLVAALIGLALFETPFQVGTICAFGVADICQHV